MAITKISELPAALSTDISSDDVLIINDGANTKKVSVLNLFDTVNTSSVTTDTLTVNTSLTIPSNSIGSDELDVSGDGTSLQFLQSDGDGSFSWATPPDTIPNDGQITLSPGNGLIGGGTFTVDQSFSETISIGIGTNSITASELNVSGDGTAGQVLFTDGDGSFSWGDATVSITDDTTTNSDFYPSLVSSTSGTFTQVSVSSTKLKFNPSTGTLEATDFNSLSDERVKTDIKTIDNSLDKLHQLRGVSFKFKETNKESIGVIAQEVESVLPEIVNTDSSGLKSVSYGNMVGLLIEAIKEQQKEIDNLKNKLGE